MRRLSVLVLVLALLVPRPADAGVKSALKKVAQPFVVAGKGIGKGLDLALQGLLWVVYCSSGACSEQEIKP